MIIIMILNCCCQNQMSVLIQNHGTQAIRIPNKRHGKLCMKSRSKSMKKEKKNICFLTYSVLHFLSFSVFINTRMQYSLAFQNTLVGFICHCCCFLMQLLQRTTIKSSVVVFFSFLCVITLLLLFVNVLCSLRVYHCCCCFFTSLQFCLSLSIKTESIVRMKTNSHLVCTHCIALSNNNWKRIMTITIIIIYLLCSFFSSLPIILFKYQEPYCTFMALHFIISTHFQNGSILYAQRQLRTKGKKYKLREIFVL